MNFKLNSPCSNCPFRSDKYFYLNRRGEIAAELQNDHTFICHKTVTGEQWDEDTGEFINANNEHNQHCAGALIVMHKDKTLWGNFPIRLAIMIGIFDPKGLDLDAPVYDSLEEFANDEQDFGGETDCESGKPSESEGR